MHPKSRGATHSCSMSMCGGEWAGNKAAAPVGGGGGGPVNISPGTIGPSKLGKKELLSLPARRNNSSS